MEYAFRVVTALVEIPGTWYFEGPEMKTWNWSFSICAIVCVVCLIRNGNSAAQKGDQAGGQSTPGGKTIVTVARSTPDYTRKGEGDVIELKDSRLLLVYMEFSGNGSDFAKTRL